MSKFPSFLVSVSALALMAAPAAMAQVFPASIAVSDLDGTDGFTMTVSPFGTGTISNAGDFNGDGIDDFIAANAGATVGTEGAAGIVYVVFGQDGGFPQPFDFSTLDGTNGFVLQGVTANDYTGMSIDGVGDFNGDGLDDILIGASNADPNGSGSGTSYLVFGKAGAYAPVTSLASLDGSNGFAIHGAAEGDLAGNPVRGAGDVNQDGYADLLIGAEGADPGGKSFAGAAFVVFGHAGPFAASFDLADINGSNGFALNGALAGDRAGYGIGGAGDVNGDGVDDVIVSAVLANPGGLEYAGTSYVVYGKTTGFAASFELASVDGSNGFAIHGAAYHDQSGNTVSGAGDVNGDGVDDVIIGAYLMDYAERTNFNSAYVVFGRASAFPASLNLSDLDGSNGFALNGAGRVHVAQVSDAGDVNGDGYADLILGDDFARPTYVLESGGAWVVFGKASGFAASVPLADLDGNDGFVVYAKDIGDHLGHSVSGAGDINHDGIDDVVISVGDWQKTAAVYGKTYPIGPTTLFSSVLPAARSGYMGGPPITVFASVHNAGNTNQDVNCQAQVPANAPVSLSVQPTDSNNVPAGAPDQPFSINPGETLSSILIFTPTATSSGEQVFPQVVCDNSSVSAIPGVNTVFLSIDAAPVPDILSISATPTGDGIINVPANGINFMAASATNFGAGDAPGSSDASITVSVDDGGAGLPLLLQLCETDSAGTCISPLGQNVTTTINTGPSFFGVFVSDQDSGGIALDAANTRVYLRFTDIGGTVRSVTSAAVTASIE